MKNVFKLYYNILLSLVVAEPTEPVSAPILAEDATGLLETKAEDISVQEPKKKEKIRERSTSRSRKKVTMYLNFN